MKVQLLRPAPDMGADKGDIVDLPEWQADNWVARGTAAPVGSDEAEEAAAEADAEAEVGAEANGDSLLIDLGNGWFERPDGEKVRLKAEDVAAYEAELAEEINADNDESEIDLSTLSDGEDEDEDEDEDADEDEN